MNIEWDPEKAESNLLKHQLSFMVAGRVFLDPERIETLDSRKDYGEARWINRGFGRGHFGDGGLYTSGQGWKRHSLDLSEKSRQT